MCVRIVISNLFGTRDQFWRKQAFHRPGVGNGFRMIQAHYIYCALHFYYYYIVIDNEIIIQLTINAESVQALSCFPATKYS